jgi:exosortase E/protease (VPEID-CTERM system)
LPLATNFALFGALTIATVAFSRYAATVETPPWGLYSGYLALLAATGVSLAWIAAPAGVWQTLLREHRLTVALALLAGIAALLAGALFQATWSELSGVTLRLSHAILTLYETNVRVDYGARNLGVGNFLVHIDGSCSGYEGVGLVLVFLGLYLWVFRASLRFPNALLLLPLGVGTIWLLNALRIAVLVSIGGHASPELAIGGFHSQAGWIAFLMVSIGIMATAPRLAFFCADDDRREGGSAGDRVMLAFLAPFMGLMAASVVTAAASPFDTWFYALKVGTMGALLWIFRDVYRGLPARAGAFAVGVGLVVGALWVATAPIDGGDPDLPAWIAAQPLGLAMAWLAIRAAGSVVLVPIAEELAFRGMLHRWLISRNFETVSYSAFTWTAFLVSSALFGLMHQRWLAGALAGAAFAIVMYRSGRLSDAIAAHMTANAVIVTWAIATQSWFLL